VNRDFHSIPPPYHKVISFSDRDSPETWEIHTVLTSLITYKSTAFSCHENLKPYEILICSQSLSLLKFQKVKSTVSDLMKSLKTWYLVHRIYYSTVGPYHIPISNSTTSPLSMLHKKYGYTFSSAGQHLMNHKFYVHVTLQHRYLIPSTPNTVNRNMYSLLPDNYHTPSVFLLLHWHSKRTCPLPD